MGRARDTSRTRSTKSQVVVTECLERKGMHVMEDAFIVEVVDPESGEPVPDGITGDLAVTCLYKSGSPQIRYRIKDLAALIPGERACGGTTRRLSALKGRRDATVNVKGRECQG